MAYDIVELEKVIESQYITRSLSNRTDTLITEAEALRSQNNLGHAALEPVFAIVRTSDQSRLCQERSGVSRNHPILL